MFFFYVCLCYINGKNFQQNNNTEISVFYDNSGRGRNVEEEVNNNGKG